MLIMSQDRKQIINFNRISILWIDDNKTNKENKNYEIYADGELIAIYQTEEKAERVLNDILVKIKLKAGDTFTMPED